MVLEKRADPDIPAVGSERVMKFVMGPAKMTWHARRTIYDPPHSFGETMLKGPFWKWDHEHIFEEKDGITTVIDQIDYKVPFGFLGEIVDKVLVDASQTEDRQDVQSQGDQIAKGPSSA